MPIVNKKSKRGLEKRIYSDISSFLVMKLVERKDNVGNVIKSRKSHNKY